MAKSNAEHYGEKHQALSAQLQKELDAVRALHNTSLLQLKAIEQALNETVMPRDIRRQLLEIIK